MTSTSSKTISRIALALLLLAASGSATAAGPEAEARQAVQETTSEVLALLADRSLNNTVRVERLTELAGRRFDMERMGKLILGRNRRQLSPEQQQAFIDEWRRHLTVTYGDSLDRFSNERIQIVSARLEGNGDVTVKTAIVDGAAGPGIAVDYRMRGKDGPWRVLDVFIEGVSLVQSFRAQVQDIVSTHGAEALITILRQKNDAKEAQRTAADAAPGAG